MVKRALITGVTGQDGAYLTELLLDKGYKVYGSYRRTSSANFWRLTELGVLGHPNLELVEFDLTDFTAAIRLLEKCQPDEIYNLAAQSFVSSSFEQPLSTAQITGLGVLGLLEAIRIVNPRIRFYQASTSEMFGMAQTVPQTEKTAFYPRSPYGVAKLFAHWTVINYRESYGIFAASGILFNHESPLRGKEFVTRKITDGVARIVAGHLECLELGNLNARRDWGFAKEYVDGMHRMLQVETPGAYVLATHRTETVRDFATMSFRVAGIDLEWSGVRAEERGVDSRTGVTRVRISPKYYRPAEVELLVGDASLARRELGWSATTRLEDLCGLMVHADIRRVRDGAPC